MCGARLPGMTEVSNREFKILEETLNLHSVSNENFI